jgi:hypothetical protein
MKTSSVFGLLLLLVSGWVAAENDADTDEKSEAIELSPEIEKLLNETSDPDEYAKSPRCISTYRIRNSRVLDDRHVIFEMPQRKYMLVQFKYSCQRLRRTSALIYETRGGGQLCRMDQIRAGNINERPGPPCSIPGFTEVTAEQLSLLREALKNPGRHSYEGNPEPDSDSDSEEKVDSG